MLQAALRLLGVDLNQKLAEIRAHIDEIRARAISEVTEQAKETGLTVGLALIGAVAVLLTFIVALAALYLLVDMHEGPFAALGAVGLVTALLAALMFALAFRRGRRKTAPAPVYLSPAASPPASPSAPVLLSAVVPPPPPNASFFDVLRHRFSTRAAAAGDEVIDTAVRAMRTSSRPALFGTLAVVALVGVLIGRRR
ncbi:MAG: hypothetical protein JO282_05815 [Alphaproteobacteria bacterium]|nr:hypothetical protein [Alphaproteobacteria bacterium]